MTGMLMPLVDGLQNGCKECRIIKRNYETNIQVIKYTSNKIYK